MSPFKHILAATDFSAPADQAVRRAALLARQHDARLHIVHVVDPARPSRLLPWVAPRIDPDLQADAARARLHRLGSELTGRFDVTAHLELRVGNVVEQLQRLSPRADLLVVGHRRRNALAELVLGSTGQRLVEHCRRPLLVVKRTAGHGYRRALVPIDFTQASDAAAFVAAALAPSAELQVFHAFDRIGEAVLREADVRESVIRESRAREEAVLLARMRRNMARLGLDSDKMSLTLGRGSPLSATLRQARSLDADVLVATKRRGARIAPSLLGHVNGLLARSSCDLLIVSGEVRDRRHAEAPAVRRAAARAADGGGPRPAHAPVAYGSSWMRAQLPAEAFMAGEHGRPLRAGG